MYSIHIRCTPRNPGKYYRWPFLEGPGQRGCECACVRGRGRVRAWEHTNALRAGLLQPQRCPSIRCRLQTTARTARGPGCSPLLLSLLQTSWQVLRRGLHSCALQDFCDLRGLHHSFLEEGFCLGKGQQRLWGPSQTLVPRGSLRGEAVLLGCWQGLQAIHQGSW